MKKAARSRITASFLVKPSAEKTFAPVLRSKDKVIVDCKREKRSRRTREKVKSKVIEDTPQFGPSPPKQRVEPVREIRFEVDPNPVISVLSPSSIEQFSFECEPAPAKYSKEFLRILEQEAQMTYTPETPGDDYIRATDVYEIEEPREATPAP